MANVKIRTLCLSLLMLAFSAGSWAATEGQASNALQSGAQTLQDAAGKRLLVGCAAATVDLKDEKLAALIVKQFGCLTPEYEFMSEHLVDEKGKYTFTRGDAVVAFAEKNKTPVFGHMLVWHFVTRKWLFGERTTGARG